MKVLIVGGGGREHALALAVARSPGVDAVICAPGNAGTATIGENVPLDVMDLAGLADLARERRIDLTIVGPEAPLCGGIVDHFEKAGLRVFGPSRSAARIEGDKAFAKRLMRSADIPTADGRVFTEFEDAKAYVATRDCALVVKASGLAAGKGVVVCEEPAEAILALERIMVERQFGDAGRCVVVEERLKGEELSVLALVQGRTICVLETAQDHKAVGDGDTGPNTGGMGAFSPSPLATRDVLRRIERDVLIPAVDALAREDHPYKGVLYAGLMITPAGPKVLEFNCRFGDPETQVVIPRIRSGFLAAMEAVADDRLDRVRIEWDARPAVCVVLASAGYPGPYGTGKVIKGIDLAERDPDVTVYHSGTRSLEHLTVTDGGRVLAVTGRGDTLADARDRAYAAVEQIKFEGAFHRHDIAVRA